MHDKESMIMALEKLMQVLHMMPDDVKPEGEEMPEEEVVEASPEAPVEAVVGNESEEMPVASPESEGDIPFQEGMDLLKKKKV